MAADAEFLTKEVHRIFDTKWDARNGTVLPEPENVTLSGGAVRVTATFLYADLAGSSLLAQYCPWETTAKIIRAYLDISTRLIRAYGGQVRSFDGDRVMGIFKTDTPNIHAVKCAREIDWMVHNVLNPKAKTYNSIKNNNIVIKHCVGVDTSEAVAVRAGISGNNDLIWIGKAPSFAAKLSDIRKYPYEVYISKECYDKIGASNQSPDGKNIWVAETFEYAGSKYTVYKTNNPLKP
jgi:adenylate cyclase